MNRILEGQALQPDIFGILLVNIIMKRNHKVNRGIMKRTCEMILIGWKPPPEGWVKLNDGSCQDDGREWVLVELLGAVKVNGWMVLQSMRGSV
jgi:hypothetical protein